jgi:two-component system chemotaxis sensor kinase CheA
MTFGDMDSLRPIFFQECEEQLAELESGLLEIESGGSDPEIVNAVFRAVHSMKGGAGAFALEELVRFAHIFETVLDEVRKGRLTTAAPVVETLLRAADLLADLVRIARDGGVIEEVRNRSVSDELAALSNAQLGAAAEPEDSIDDLDFKPVVVSLPLLDAAAGNAEPLASEYTITFAEDQPLYKRKRARDSLRELERLGEVSTKCDTASVPPLTDLDPEGAYLLGPSTSRRDTMRMPFATCSEFVDGDCELSIAAKPVAGAERKRRRSAPQDGARGACREIALTHTADVVPSDSSQKGPLAPQSNHNQPPRRPSRRKATNRSRRKPHNRQYALSSTGSTV